MNSRQQLIKSFRDQARYADYLGSPFTAALMNRAAASLEQGGPIAALLGDWPGDPFADGLPLRFAGALHALVLTGADPGLAALYPPHAADIDTVWQAVEAAMSARPEHFADYLARPPNQRGAPLGTVVARFCRHRARHRPEATPARDRRQCRFESTMGPISLSLRRQGLGRSSVAGDAGMRMARRAVRSRRARARGVARRLRPGADRHRRPGAARPPACLYMAGPVRPARAARRGVGDDARRPCPGRAGRRGRLGRGPA